MGKSAPITDVGGQVTVLASAARTTTNNSEVFYNECKRGVHIVIDVTAIVSTPSTTFTLQGYSQLGDDYYTILASAALATTGVTVLKVFPGATAAANAAANDMLPPYWRVAVTHGNANSMTYSVSAQLLA